MRKKFVFFVLVPLLALCIVLYLFAERWIESGLEEAGEGIVGAKVEIDNLRLSISPVAIEFSRFQVTNPKDTWKNIFETGRVRFALNIGQLIRNKYIVETMEVNNLIFGTKRATDGSLPKPRSLSGESSSIIIEATAALTREAKKAPVFDLEKLRKGLKIDSLLSVQSLRTIRHLDSLKLQVQEASQQWRATLADIEKSKQRAAEIEANIKAINLNELRTIESIAGAINKVSAAYKDINELNETFKNRRAAITDQINRLYSSVAMVDDLARADYEMVKGFARLPDLSTQGMANLLLGKEILHKVNNYLSWVDFARTTVPKYLPEPEYEKPKRFQGQDIHFPVERAYPKWWIKNVVISGGEDKNQNPDYFYAHGAVHNITNNQRITGFPLTVALSGFKARGASFTFDASVDRQPEVPIDNYRLVVQGLAVGDVEFGETDFVPSKITQAVATVAAEVSVPGNRFDSRLSLGFRDLALSFDRPPRNDVERIVRDVLASISAFRVQLRTWNTAGPFDLALTTDLDDQLAARTKKVIGDELARLQSEIRSKVNQRIAEKRAEFEKIFNQRKEEAVGRLRAYESLVNEKIAMADSKKKELETRVEQEKKKQTDTVKKKLEDAVKGLFKKQ
jgi:uncharacterized protein (TIGR03545 family)